MSHNIALPHLPRSTRVTAKVLKYRTRCGWSLQEGNTRRKSVRLVRRLGRRAVDAASPADAARLRPSQMGNTYATSLLRPPASLLPTRQGRRGAVRPHPPAPAPHTLPLHSSWDAACRKERGKGGNNHSVLCLSWSWAPGLRRAPARVVASNLESTNGFTVFQVTRKKRGIQGSMFFFSSSSFLISSRNL